MKFSFSKEWCVRAAKAESEINVAAGTPAIFLLAEDSPINEKRIAFSKFISLARREKRLTVQALAEKTDTEFEELLAIECDPNAPIGIRSVSKLSHFFGVPTPAMMQLAGLTTLRDHPLPVGAVRAAAHSASMAALTRDEQRLLEELIACLTSGQINQ